MAGKLWTELSQRRRNDNVANHRGLASASSNIPNASRRTALVTILLGIIQQRQANAAPSNHLPADECSNLWICKRTIDRFGFRWCFCRLNSIYLESSFSSSTSKHCFANDCYHVYLVADPNVRRRNWRHYCLCLTGN